VEELFSISAAWKGSIMGIGPCILTKVMCACFLWGDKASMKWVIGWAMVGRAEFAYLIAQLAASSNMMSPEVFSVVIVSLLWATVFAPFLFRYVLGNFVKAQAKLEAGGEWTEEEEKKFDEDHPELNWENTEFRQSGHLPAVGDDKEHGDKKQDEHGHALPEVHHNASKGDHGGKVVHSEYEAEDRGHTVHAAAPMAHPYDNYSKEIEKALDANGQSRGSGFLCCLFFRKIIIM
jgi:hypothetical protein